MHLTQGTFSFLPDLTDGQITAQIQYCIDNGWAVSIEHTADPHPRNIYWDMFGAPMFDLADAAEAMLEINNCRASFPDHYIKLNALDATRSIESVRLSFMVNRPANRAFGCSVPNCTAAMCSTRRTVTQPNGPMPAGFDHAVLQNHATYAVSP